MHTGSPTTVTASSTWPTSHRTAAAMERTSTRAREASASRDRGRTATRRPTTTRRRGDVRYSRTRMPTMASPSIPSIEIHACVFTVKISASAVDGRTEELGPVAAGRSHELANAAGMVAQVRGDIVDAPVVRRPGVVASAMLGQLRRRDAQQHLHAILGASAPFCCVWRARRRASTARDARCKVAPKERAP